MVNTLDITTYFKSPYKNGDVAKDCKNKENDSINESVANVSSVEMDFFNDELDDMLSNMEVNI